MKTKLIRFYFFLFTFNFLLVATATVRYVSKTGSSTPPYTTWATASDSIQKCINICQSGDTVYVAKGVYKENLIINTEISLIGLSMDSTVIDGRGMNSLTIVLNSNGTIKNLKIFGKDQESWENSAIWAATQNTLINIRNCQIVETGWGVSSVSTFLYADNLFIKDVKSGFSFLSATTSNSLVSNCIIQLSTQQATGISVGYAPNGIFHFNNNIILYNRQFNNYEGHGIYLGLPRKVYINNNLICGFSDNIFVDDIMDTVFIANNILVHQKTLSSNPASIMGSGDIMMVNNNIHKSNKQAINGGLIKLDYNIFWENNRDLVTAIYGDSDRVADPMFMNDTVPTPLFNFDHHLQAFSPAIDRGDPSTLDVDGTRSDIGMYGGPFGEKTYYKDLAPKPPRNLSVIVDTIKITIKWNRSTEADTAYYKVYRDTVQNFTIDSTKLIGIPNDTMFYHPLLPNGRYFYKVACVDNQGNESKLSEEIVVSITSINDYPMTINDYLLYQNYPNPFNPTTTIGYKLKERGYVKLMVYDIKGELLSVLVNQDQEAGYYEVEFNTEVGSRQLTVENRIASGIYLYRIEVIGEGNIPVYAEMRKMLMIK